MTSIRPLSILLIALIACSPEQVAHSPEGEQVGGKAPEEPTLVYPEVARSDQVDDYFGVKVEDPYRWLEDLEAAAVRQLVERQNALTQPYLEAIPVRRRIIERMTELWGYARATPPVKRGGRYFFEANDGDQEQDVLMVADSLDKVPPQGDKWAEPRVLIDPNTLRQDATIGLSSWQPSPDGALVAYGISDGGSDWKSWKVLEVDSGQDSGDRIRHMKFSSVAWTPDAAGFYYSRYPLGEDGEADDSRPVAVYHHRIGTPQSEDLLIYTIDDGSDHDPYGLVTDDGRYLIFIVYEGYSANAVYYKDLTAAAGAAEVAETAVVRLLDEWDAIYSFLGNRGDELFFSTTHQAPNGRVVAIDTGRPEPDHWRQVVPEGEHALDEVSLVGGRVIVEDLVDARSRVRLFETDGSQVGEVELPGVGTVTGFAGKVDDPETFFELETFTAPPAVYRFDASTSESAVFRRPETTFDAGAYDTEQVFYASKDGTRVPMFLIHRRGLERDGENPTMLYGYGGFNVSETPEFKVRWAMWLEMGGLLAVANLRGGGEYGEDWHQAGIKTRKQNVFDDFIAAAEWLIAENYTRTAKLAIHGRSNGGLLVGAVMTQRPELFGVALPAVGVLDMLRYHTASANAYQWGSDLGWSENQDDFQAQHAYSPVHNVSEGNCFPPTLVTTADRDDRVVPWHSYKFTAALQHAQGCDQPILLRIETRAGHGGNKPTWMRIEDYADQWAFAARHLGMEISG